jgi:hypothetical protein
MPEYPLTFTVSNPHSKVSVTGKIQGMSYPFALETKSVEDLFNVDEVLTISIVVEE